MKTTECQSIDHHGTAALLITNASIACNLEHSFFNKRNYSILQQQMKQLQKNLFVAEPGLVITLCNSWSFAATAEIIARKPICDKIKPHLPCRVVQCLLTKIVLIFTNTIMPPYVQLKCIKIKQKITPLWSITCFWGN